MKIRIYNPGPNGKVRWELKLEKDIPTNTFHISDASPYSLFNNPLAKGDTEGECLNNFLKIETELIQSV